jgi:SAM-dependent methyltransferase
MRATRLTHPMTSEPARLFSERTDSYVRFIRSVLYPQGIRAYFLRAPYLRSGLRILDAGCGTGVVTLALHATLVRRGLVPGAMHAFDLTPAMLNRFREGLSGVSTPIELAVADVLRLDQLPAAWRDYDLIVTASMLEYLPRERFAAALAGLRGQMRPGGRLVLFITRRNVLTRPLIGRWWAANLYSAAEVLTALKAAGFEGAAPASFPLQFRHLALWGHVVVASNPLESGGAAPL